MLGGFPLKVEVESVHWEDQSGLISRDTLSAGVMSPVVMSPIRSPSLTPGNGVTVLSSGVAGVISSTGGVMSPGTVGGGMSLYDDRMRHQSASRLISPVTQRWLSENYEIAEGCSVPRNVLYEHYLDFCVRNSVQPVNAASFGKIIRQHFPSLKTRRLGSRGQSKYHYYGLTIKDTSQYHMNDYTYKQPSSVPQHKPSNTVSPVKPLPSDVLASLLPDFPKVRQLKIPTKASTTHIGKFLESYHIYAHSVLEVIVKASFSEVEPLLMKFWSSFDEEELASLDKFPDIVAYCDILLFKTIISLLLPTPLHPIPSSLTQTIRSFCKQYGGWSKMAVAGLSDNLVTSVLQASDLFVAMMRRQTTLTHIAQATRTVLSSSSAVSQMIHDWCHLDIDSMTHQAMFLFSTPNGGIKSGVLKGIQSEFSELLGEQASVEEYAEWIKELVDKFVVKRSETPEKFKKYSQRFVTQWSYFISRIVRDLTLRSAPSFGSFHLLHMLFSDYVLHLVEEYQQTSLQNKLWIAITGSPATQDNTQPSVLTPHNNLKQHSQQHGGAPIEDKPEDTNSLVTSGVNSKTTLNSASSSPQRTESRALPSNPSFASNPPFATLSNKRVRVNGDAPDADTATSASVKRSAAEISVTDDLVEVTTEDDLAVTSSSSDVIMSPILSDLTAQDDVDMEASASMLSSSQTSIFSISNGLTSAIGRLTDKNRIPNCTNTDIISTQDLILNEGDTLSDNLMEEILKCVSNSSCS